MTVGNAESNDPVVLQPVSALADVVALNFEGGIELTPFSLHDIAKLKLCDLQLAAIFTLFCHLGT